MENTESIIETFIANRGYLSLSGFIPQLYSQTYWSTKHSWAVQRYLRRNEGTVALVRLTGGFSPEWVAYEKNVQSLTWHAESIDDELRSLARYTQAAQWQNDEDLQGNMAFLREFTLKVSGHLKGLVYSILTMDTWGNAFQQLLEVESPVRFLRKRELVVRDKSDLFRCATLVTASAISVLDIVGYMSDKSQYHAKNHPETRNRLNRLACIGQERSTDTNAALDWLYEGMYNGFEFSECIPD